MFKMKYLNDFITLFQTQLLLFYGNLNKENDYLSL